MISLENKILNKTEIIPCHYLEWDLFEICHFPKKDNYESFIQFLNDQTDLLKELRTLSENVKIRLHNIDLKQVDELLKSKVLGLNRDSTKDRYKEGRYHPFLTSSIFPKDSVHRSCH